MVRKTGLRVRAVARVVAWVAPGTVVLVLAGACSEQRGSIGDDCLKNQDCLSGVCSELHCVVPPPLLDAAYTPVDAAADALAEAQVQAEAEAASGDDAAMVVTPDATTPPSDAPVGTGDATTETGTVAPGDAAADVVDEVHADAPTDGPTDAIADAGEAG
jgi:hypothetical protein